jgi:hypothetical protein
MIIEDERLTHTIIPPSKLRAESAYKNVECAPSKAKSRSMPHIVISKTF